MRLLPRGHWSRARNPAFHWLLLDPRSVALSDWMRVWRDGWGSRKVRGALGVPCVLEALVGAAAAPPGWRTGRYRAPKPRPCAALSWCRRAFPTQRPEPARSDCFLKEGWDSRDGERVPRNRATPKSWVSLLEDFGTIPNASVPSRWTEVASGSSVWILPEKAGEGIQAEPAQRLSAARGAATPQWVFARTLNFSSALRTVGTDPCTGTQQAGLGEPLDGAARSAVDRRLWRREAGDGGGQQRAGDRGETLPAHVQGEWVLPLSQLGCHDEMTRTRWPKHQKFIFSVDKMESHLSRLLMWSWEAIKETGLMQARHSLPEGMSLFFFFW
nr:uncharacterized protein LOC111774588 [Equus caballus]XP_023502509.1 uncharacterized protein LOC111774588 [Equus caballus]